MNSNKNKKILALLMSFLMIITTVPFSGLVSAADCPVIKEFGASPTDFQAYYASIYTATFLDEIVQAEVDSAYESWDVSAAGDNSVMAYININEEATKTAGENRYDLYIAGNGGIEANPRSRYIFYDFWVLTRVSGCENLKTENVNTFYGLFLNCYKLESITGINWDTSNVTDMSYMFRNCYELKELDLSSFDTSKVTTIKYMFYQCKKLRYIYVGDGWTTQSVKNLNDGVFNCCYAIVADMDIVTEEDEKAAMDVYDALGYKYVPPTASFAKLKEDGGFLTYAEKAPEPETVYYTVTYALEGDIPELYKDTVEVSFEAEENTVITVENPLFAEGYEFSGWTSEDADITEGTFTLTSDVTIKGRFDKLYTVTYKYNEKYLLPEDAPVLPAAAQYKAGTDVDALGVPYSNGYIFVGWTTDDAEVIGDMFEMPEGDVVFYGYFKKPVESVEFMGEDITLDTDGGSAKLNVYVKPEDATIKDLVYESSDESVVTVDKYGNITPVGIGEATVTVTSKDDSSKTDSIKVTVKNLVTDIVIDKNDIVLNKDKTHKIEAYVTPEDATNKKIIYKSGDESIATVDEDGNVTAVGEGTTTITVTSADNPNVTGEITVTVKIPVTEITATEDFTLNIDEEKNLEAKVNSDATNKVLLYHSDNPDAVIVDDKGNVLAVGAGTATITITSKDDPSKTETVKVTVKPEETTTEPTTLPEETTTTEPTTLPEETTTTEPTTLPVETTTTEPTTLPEETTTTESTTLPEETTTTRPEEPTEPEKPKTYTVVISGKKEMEIDEKQTLTAFTKEPLEDGTDGTFRFFTYDSDIIELDPVTGKVKALKAGTAVVKATLLSTGDQETFEIIVISPDYEIVAPDSFSVGVGEKLDLGVTVSPDKGSPEIIYTSADTSVATVDAKGKVTGVAEGTTTVTVEVHGKVKEIYVTVLPEPVIKGSHYICFGKTDGIGWYEVSVNGGEFKVQGPNSTLEVEEGSVVTVRMPSNAVIYRDFTFYVNGSKVEQSAPNEITFTVNGYMLIGALTMDLEVPDTEESLNLFEKIIKGIKEFFEKIFSIFK